MGAQSCNRHFEDIVGSEAKDTVMGHGGWALRGLRLEREEAALAFWRLSRIQP